MKTLITEKQIAQRVAELGREISGFYRGKPLTVVVILNGAMPFAMDLIRKIDYSVRLDSIAVSSYVNDRSSGELNIRSAMKHPAEGRHLLLIDDILDTGLTMKKLLSHPVFAGAASVRTCILLNKNVSSKVFHHPDWTGFNIPDEYVVGYGMDSEEEYRNLPYIGVIEN